MPTPISFAVAKTRLVRVPINPATGTAATLYTNPSSTEKLRLVAAHFSVNSSEEWEIGDSNAELLRFSSGADNRSISLPRNPIGWCEFGAGENILWTAENSITLRGIMLLYVIP